MGTTESYSVGERVREARASINRRAVYGGGIVGGLVNLNAIFIPPFVLVGGGVVGGFIAGYAAGGLSRGTAHGALAGVIVGLISGTLVAFLGMLLGLYTQHPTLIGKLTGFLVAPVFDRTGPGEPILVLLGTTAVITLDGLVGGVIGGLLRSAVDRIAGRD